MVHFVGAYHRCELEISSRNGFLFRDLSPAHEAYFPVAINWCGSCAAAFFIARFVQLIFLIRQYVLYRKGNNHAVPKSEQLLARYCFVQIMGPNPLKLCEEMILAANEIVDSGTASSSSVVLDLGSGTGITTALLAREFGCVAYAADLWSNPTENMRFLKPSD